MAPRKKTESDKTPNSAGEQVDLKDCFIIMPIADRDGYEAGHFKRVYDWVIKPACIAAGYQPVRADDVSSSNFIVADILQRIVEAPMAICDISSLNANVMFELGIRQAFGKPVALIKDEKTKSVFDISGLRYTEYASSLRADLVEKSRADIEQMIIDTASPDSGITSLMQLVNIGSAEIPQKEEVSADTRLLLNEIHKLVASTRNGQFSRFKDHSGGVSFNKPSGRGYESLKGYSWNNGVYINEITLGSDRPISHADRKSILFTLGNLGIQGTKSNLDSTRTGFDLIIGSEEASSVKELLLDLFSRYPFLFLDSVSYEG